MLFKTKKKSSKNVPEKLVQDLIPVRNIYSEVIETTDNRLIKIINVSSVNTTLMSYNQQAAVLNQYESFLKSIKKSIQISRIAEPINLKNYIFDLQQENKEIDNPHKRMMMTSYIEFAKGIQESKDMTRRSCYVTIYEKFSDEKSKEKAIKHLEVYAKDMILKLEEMLYETKLEARQLSNEELKRMMHLFMDYENAQINNIGNDLDLPYIIGKRSLHEAAERIKKGENDYSYL
ncbi:hypothetical protein COE43_12650 [Bacillus cereus]|nr:hypothetical protein COE43_12650 [Bacillus cereus]